MRVLTMLAVEDLSSRRALERRILKRIDVLHQILGFVTSKTKATTMVIA